MDSILIRGKEYPLRDWNTASLSDCLRATEINVRFLKMVKRLFRGEDVDETKVRQQSMEYYQMFIPTLTLDIVENLSADELDRLVGPELLEKTLPMGLAMMERYPEVKEYHDRLMTRTI